MMCVREKPFQDDHAMTVRLAAFPSRLSHFCNSKRNWMQKFPTASRSRILLLPLLFMGRKDDESKNSNALPRFLMPLFAIARTTWVSNRA
jgi:hypothetical protein